MNVRDFTGKDYEVLCKWWEDWGWPRLDRLALPTNGLVVEDKSGQLLSMGFMYLTDSSFGILEWITGNPKVEKLLRRESLDKLIVGLLKKAQDHGATLIFTSTKHQGLVQRMKKFDFIPTDVGMTNMVAKLGGNGKWA